jgi:hypothetical protein
LWLIFRLVGEDGRFPGEEQSDRNQDQDTDPDNNPDQELILLHREPPAFLLADLLHCTV